MGVIFGNPQPLHLLEVPIQPLPAQPGCKPCMVRLRNASGEITQANSSPSKHFGKKTHTQKKETNQPTKSQKKETLTTTMKPTHMEKTGSYKNHRQITSPCPPSRKGGVGSQCLLELVPEPAQFTQFGAQEQQDVARCSVGDSSLTLTS